MGSIYIVNNFFVYKFMKNYFKLLHFKHYNFWNKNNFFSLYLSGLLFAVALFIQTIADYYVGNLSGTPVNDIILSNLPTLDIDSLIIISTFIVTFSVIYLFATKPQYLNFGIKAVSIFIIVRSFFISLTHLGASPDQLQFNPNSIGYWLYNVLYNTRGDFFFSGHTGIPFLMALIFWSEKKWRVFFLIFSLLSGAGVLLAHIHYSIDVFAAPFMSFGIFAIAKKLFKKDYSHAQ
jgi:hypothetical protein